MMDKSKQVSFKTLIRCITYNHKPYIKDAMNGFCMQQTTFPFVCAIFDDCSTDEEQKEIKLYLQEHFDLEDKSIVKSEETDDYVLTFARHKDNHNCYFAVYFLRYNHYSIGKHYRKHEYCKDFREQVKYIALCEGDDYWTDPYKLQKQVDYLESHPECTMVCNRTKRYSERDKHFIEDSFCLEKDVILETKDVIRKGGLYISTCSIIYRKSLLVDYPIYCIKCHVGDYPLQIMAAMKGKVYYYNDAMSVYRVQINDSWTSRNNASGCLTLAKLNGIYSEVNMLFSFGDDYKHLERIFHSRAGFYIFSHIRVLGNEDRLKLFKVLKCFIEELPFMWRLLIFSFAYDIPLASSILYRLQRKEFVKYICS